MLKQMTVEEINALKRLQRTGDPQSATNQKLREAVRVMEQYILAITREFGPALVVLRRGYETYGHFEEHLLWGPPPMGAVHADAELWVLHRFAADVADGLIEEIEEDVINARQTGY